MEGTSTVSSIVPDKLKKLDLYELTNKLNAAGLKLKSARDISMLACAFVEVYSYKGRRVYNWKEKTQLWQQGEELELIPGKEERYVTSLCREFKIKKKSGGYRKVVSFDPYLVGIYKAMLEVMYPYYENVIPKELCGCRPGVGIAEIIRDITKAMDDLSPNSTGGKYANDVLIGHLDLVDWFGSIDSMQVDKVLDTHFLQDYKGKSGKVNTSELIATILTYKGRLAQGSPCSPLLANAVAANTWAPKVLEYCKENSLFLRIYVDNIIVVFKGPLMALKEHLDKIEGIIGKEGFRCHKKSMKAAYRQQKILGVVLNKPHQPRVPRHIKNMIRTIMFKANHLHKDGCDRFPIIEDWYNKYGGNTKIEPGNLEEIAYKCEVRKTFHNWILGVINWIGQFDHDKELAKKYKELAAKYFDPVNII